MSLSRVKQYLPWWGKILAKLVLSRMPVDYSKWQRMRIFRHGHMDEASYSINVFNMHVDRAGLNAQLIGRLVLELGPGDSVATALIAKAHGARTLLVDAGSFAVDDVRSYLSLSGELREYGLDVPDLSEATSLEELLKLCEARYLTNGLESLRQISDNSVDLIYSQAVLEHVRKADFLDTMQECARILKPEGICSHRVDLRDHLGGGLNNLRFSNSVWEADFFAKSGFYTNRIQFSSMVELFQKAGFYVDVTHIDRWSSLPIKRRQMNQEFRNIPEPELLISGFDLLLYKT